jgi:hypothetical protein
MTYNNTSPEHAVRTIRRAAERAEIARLDAIMGGLYAAAGLLLLAIAAVAAL